MPHATVLAQLSGQLMSIDISDVLPGDVVFLGGHLVRRAWARPKPPTRKEDWVGFQGLRLDEPTDGSAARGCVGRLAGTAVLVLRPCPTDPIEKTNPHRPHNVSNHGKEGTAMSYPEGTLAREVRRAAVARVIFCPVTGQVLDVRTAVLLESADGQRVLAVLSPEGWAQRAEAVRAAMPGLVVTNAKEAGR